MHTLVLASASPRRRELLTQAGFHFRVLPANIPEEVLPGEDPQTYVTRLALQKAQAIHRTLAPTEPGVIVLGADTTVVIDDHILGKPADAPNPIAEATRMLRLLSGRTHRVMTGIALVSSTGSHSAAEITSVDFSPLTDSDIAAYIATGEPMDKAGAYAIQGLAARWIPSIQGCYFNVVGLPIAAVTQLIEQIQHQL
jgi:septum formation protein